jgi:hypothetical protein
VVREGSPVLPAAVGSVPHRPVETLVIGGFVCGLSKRDIESLCEAGIGELSRSTWREDLHERFQAFKPIRGGRGLVSELWLRTLIGRLSGSPARRERGASLGHSRLKRSSMPVSSKRR